MYDAGETGGGPGGVCVCVCVCISGKSNLYV